MTVSSKQAAQDKGGKAANRFQSFVSFIITFMLMFVSWVVLSGKFTPMMLILGAVSSFLVAFYFYDLLFPDFKPGYAGIFFRFVQYIPWLIWEIIKANFHLLYLAFHPNMIEKIEPQIITFKTSLKSDIAIATLANSITLTPGTITVTASREGVFKVHAIDSPSAEALPGAMVEKVAQVFGEE